MGLILVCTCVEQCGIHKRGVLTPACTQSNWLRAILVLESWCKKWARGVTSCKRGFRGGPWGNRRGGVQYSCDNYVLVIIVILVIIGVLVIIHDNYIYTNIHIYETYWNVISEVFWLKRISWRNPCGKSTKWSRYAEQGAAIMLRQPLAKAQYPTIAG